MKKCIGIIAPLDEFQEHHNIFKKLGCDVIKITNITDLDNINGLVISGKKVGDLAEIIQTNFLSRKIKDLADNNLPIFGICAGMVLLSKTIEDKNKNQLTLDLMDTIVRIDAFNAQNDSFKVDLDIPALGSLPVRAVFIRAPYIKEVAPNVGILAEYRDKIIFVRQGNMIASAFHPDFDNQDFRVHQYFLDIIDEEMIK